MWGPASPGVDSTWVLWIGAQFSHLQGLASVWTILFKLDIRAAFVGTISCGQMKLGSRANPASRSRSGSTSNTGTERTRNISGSIQLHSVVSQPSRTDSVENRQASALESINEAFGSAPHVESREPRVPRGEDKTNIDDKEEGLCVSEKKLGSEDEVTFRDNGPLDLQVQRHESVSDEEMGMANPAGSGSSSSSRPSISSVDTFIENDLSMVAARLSIPQETQRMVYEDAVTLGVGGSEIIQTQADEEEKVVVPVVRSEVVASPDTFGENESNMIVDCLPSDMQRMVFEDAVTLGIGGEYTVQHLSSADDDEKRLAAGTPESTHSSLDNRFENYLSKDFSSDDDFLSIIAKIPNVLSPSQRMLFEDAAALQIDCGELINEEELRSGRLP